jgi:hypothetical protein
MVAFNTIKVGDVLWEGHRTRSGQSRMSRMSWYTIKIVSVHEDHVMASWNTNPVRRYNASAVKRWRRTKPEPKPTVTPAP